jgi:transcriptional regulator with XRE-family HTH domain
MTELRKRAPGWVPDDRTFGARLAMVRQAMGWGNVKQAADLCAIPVQNWREWEREGREPRGLLNIAMKIAGVTGVDYRWLALGPSTQPASDVQEAASVTHGYSQYAALGERVIIVGTAPSGAPSGFRTDVRKGVRAHPLER